MSQQRAIVIGAGIAGSSTAWWLARAGVHVTLLEREPVPCALASGRSAACFEPAQERASIAMMARAAAPLLADRGAIVRRDGQLLVTRSAETANHWSALTAQQRTWGIRCSEFDDAQTHQRMPLLGDTPIQRAIFYADGAVLDAHGLVTGLLREAISAGATVRYHVSVSALSVRAGKVIGVQLADEQISADVVIDASGPWAGVLAGNLGAPLTLQPLLRHLALLENTGVSANAPLVHDVDVDCYARPEEGKLLVSPCDQELTAPGAGGPAQAGALELLARKMALAFPAAPDARVARVWSCQRTFASDRLPVLGPDARLAGLYYCAGLGGFGLTVGIVAGGIVADWVRGQTIDPTFAALAPARFS